MAIFLDKIIKKFIQYNIYKISKIKEIKFIYTKIIPTQYDFFVYNLK